MSSKSIMDFGKVDSGTDKAAKLQSSQNIGLKVTGRAQYQGKDYCPVVPTSGLD